MPTVPADDIAEIYGDTEMADTVTLGGSSVDGYFFAPHADTIGMGGTGPTFRCSAADAAGVAVGDTLVYSAVTYVITSRQPEKAGDVTFELRVQ